MDNDEKYLERMVAAGSIVTNAFPEMEKYSEAWAILVSIAFNKMTVNVRLDKKNVPVTNTTTDMATRKANLLAKFKEHEENKKKLG